MYINILYIFTYILLLYWFIRIHMVHIVLVRALHIRTSKLQDSLTPFLAFGKQSIPNNHSEDSETF
jgi:hypothetical protein